MANKFFFKELVNNTVLIGGKSPSWEMVEDQCGIISLSPGKDDAMIAGLNDLASRHVGGIIAITEAVYTQKKTQSEFMRLSPGSEGKEYLRLAVEPKQARPRFAPSLAAVDAPAAVVVKPTPEQMMAEAVPTVPRIPNGASRGADVVQAPVLNSTPEQRPSDVPKAPTRRISRVLPKAQRKAVSAP